ncbi:AAA family ATPase [Mycobacterium hubeiense]|uniref:AAA family ATPase n=1 Tax=Mycobacterium hubeiense TaxID=1867256 RepID=UPI000C7E95C1|nr:AAA family ATPase [Mycobacterium sp. QGD 101]
MADPPVYAPRQDVDERIAMLTGQLANLQFTQGLRLLGTRGSGKTTVLLRLRNLIRARGWLAPYFARRPGMPITAQLADAVSQAIRERGGRDPLRSAARRQTHWKASGKVPFTPIELGFESNAPEAGGDTFALVKDAIREHLVNATPVVLLIDEADFLTAAEVEDTILDIAHDAALDDLPFAVVSGGTTQEYLAAMDGVLTSSGALTEAVELKRLTDSEAFQVVTGTAALGGQDWSHSAILPEFISVARGVPRHLQVMGFRAYEAVPRIGLDDGLRDAICSCRQQRDHLIAKVARSPAEQTAILAIERILRDGRVHRWHLHRAVDASLRSTSGESIDFDDCIIRLQQAGLVEAHTDWTLEWV